MRKAFLQLHTAIFLAGFTGILGRLIELNEGLLVGWRLAISASTMWILYSFNGRLQRLQLSDIYRIMGVGGIAALHWVFFFGAIKYANISIALVCFSAAGFFTAVLDPLLFRNRVVWIELALGLVVIAGIAVIFRFEPRFEKGIIYGIVSALLGALFPMFNRIYIQRMNASTLMTWQLTGGFFSLLLLLPFYLDTFPPQNWLPGANDWIWLIILSWGCSVWAFQLTANSLKTISVFTVNLSFNLEPVYGIVLAFLLFREQQVLGPSFYGGLCLILLALCVQSWRMYYKNGRKLSGSTPK
jgi:drug/metabolite transporter (DMT)-like permease